METATPKPGRSLEEALREIKENKGAVYDWYIVETCVDLFKTVEFALSSNRPFAGIRRSPSLGFVFGYELAEVLVQRSLEQIALWHRPTRKSLTMQQRPDDFHSPQASDYHSPVGMKVLGTIT